MRSWTGVLKQGTAIDQMYCRLPVKYCDAERKLKLSGVSSTHVVSAARACVAVSLHEMIGYGRHVVIARILARSLPADR